MAEHQIRFDDGAAYERMMGAWSRLAGGIFLDWIAPRPGLRWVDVGCGNGAVTELVVERCAPAEVHGIDPSEGQLKYAGTTCDAHGRVPPRRRYGASLSGQQF
jgi:ubiquinone/menaquinone biosynthesis C-methylase UbiE